MYNWLCKSYTRVVVQSAETCAVERLALVATCRCYPFMGWARTCTVFFPTVFHWTRLRSCSLLSQHYVHIIITELFGQQYGRYKVEIKPFSFAFVRYVGCPQVFWHMTSPSASIEASGGSKGRGGCRGYSPPNQLDYLINHYCFMWNCN
jgi:hypothetical protein